MKKRRELPRRTRDVIGPCVGFGGLLSMMLLSASEEYALLLSFPFMLFYMWLCPETWSGR